MKADKKLGIMIVLMEEFKNKTLPDSLWIKNRLDKGELLNDGDMEFLVNALESACVVKNLIDKQPEWQPVFAGAVNLYENITAKALENQMAMT
jgi:hypothetical protein